MAIIGNYCASLIFNFAFYKEIGKINPRNRKQSKKIRLKLDCGGDVALLQRLQVWAHRYDHDTQIYECSQLTS